MAKVKFIARTRPFLPGDQRDDVLQTEGSVISIRDPRNPGQRIQYNEFAACYGPASTNQGDSQNIFDIEVAPMLDDVYNGNRFFVTGLLVQESPLLCSGTVKSKYLLQHRERPSSDYRYKLQFLEVYCEDCYDLLAKKDRRKKKESLSRASAFMSSQPWKSLKHLQTPTAANERSSRSHAIFKLLIYDAGSSHLKGTIEFVDLAGSERPEHVPKSQKQESASINKSLSALSGVITGLNKGSV
ncbi:17019_t:CDS:2, partial [Acaulospora colombiana]